MERAMTAMTKPVRDAADRVPLGRRAREFKMIAAMLRMYCRTHHDSKDAALCEQCAELHDYAHRRLERCVFGEAKPTCAKCTVHCYKASMRERVRVVMRWAGPRMLWRHPVLAIRHMIDGRLPAPALQRSP
jgi:hypothetical protein